jgi:peptidyl-prolyl cis-trans isomerase B (cyclophilin B)
MMKWLSVGLILLSGVACSGGSTADMRDTQEENARDAKMIDAPKSTPERPIVIMDTDSGSIVMELFPDVAPITCDSILSLVNQKFYDGLTFHRIIPGFVLQGGDPKGNGTGDAGFRIPAEFSTRKHVEGSLSMARNMVDINSSGCQFFICLAALPNLDSSFNLFGQVIAGMDVAHKLEKVPTGPGDRPLQPVVIRRMYENK